MSEILGKYTQPNQTAVDDVKQAMDLLLRAASKEVDVIEKRRWTTQYMSLAIDCEKSGKKKTQSPGLWERLTTKVLGPNY